MKHYKTLNNFTGLLVFVIASLVYGLTIEPTASFWDCGEFILSSYKLEVGHPPGAPFFMLTANFFSQFASDPSHVAMMVNLMSAVMSGACIMFLYWTITYLVKKLLSASETVKNTSQLIAIIGSGLVGAFVYMFSDTFWFSAVEGEVYAYSSLFTAVVFWLILKWDESEDTPEADRWLILIAYLTGLSIGVHLLNLLCIPAIVMVYYFKKRPNSSLKNSLIVLAFSAILVGVVLYGMIPGVIKVGGAFDLFFVNSLGYSFNTGLIAYIIVLAIILAWAIVESVKGKNALRMNISFLATLALVGIPFLGEGFTSLIIGIVILAVLGFAIYKFKNIFTARVLNTTILCITFIMVGYSSYTLIIMRSLANTPMDQNSPEEIFTLGSYLGREQYGSRPLFYGQTYNSIPKSNPEGGLVRKSESYTYIPKVKDNPNDPDEYEKVLKPAEYVFEQNMLFPRMYSQQHAGIYEQWVDIEGKQEPFYYNGRVIPVTIPTQWENIQFLLKYQVGYMYWRYFLWNFVGRQNDLQGQGDLDKGNWLTGISFIDNMAYGDQDKLPKDIQENKGRNVFYGLPLLLGIIGLLWQLNKGRKGTEQFSIVFLLFFMTGLAIILYLNQTPMQVRERDYAYAASFYAFAIWIGMGVIGVTRLVKDITNKETPAISGLVLGLSLLVPLQMGCQTWDDHDRSGRYFARDFGQNYLNSTQEKGFPIIFNNGDNDTFPLWYSQEVEGSRTDVRTCNFSYINTDWYIDQMIRPAYESPGLPIKWPRKFFGNDVNNAVEVRPELKELILNEYNKAKNKAEEGDDRLLKLFQLKYGEEPFSVQNVFEKWIMSDDPQLRVIPTDTLSIKVNKEAVLNSGMKIPEGIEIPSHIYISLSGKRMLTKGNLMFLEILANTNWERPVYVAVSVGSDEYLNLDKYLIQEGLAYRFTPFNWEKIQKDELKSKYPDIDVSKIPYQIPIDSKLMYENLMTKFKFGGMETKGIYIDENAMRMCLTHRRIFVNLANQLIEEGDTEKAMEVLKKADEFILADNVPHDFQSYSHLMAESYYQLDKDEKADEIALELADKSLSYVDWTLSLSDSQLPNALSSLSYHFSMLRNIIAVMNQYDSKHTQDYMQKQKAYATMLERRIQKLKQDQQGI